MAKINNNDQVDASPFIIGKLKLELEPTKAEHVVDLFPVYAVDRNERDTYSGDSGDDVPSVSLAHELFEAFAWVEWVSVQRVLDRFIVKVKHSYPVDVRPALRTWLGEHSLKKSGASFELQVKAVDGNEPE